MWRHLEITHRFDLISHSTLHVINHTPLLLLLPKHPRFPLSTHRIIVTTYQNCAQFNYISNIHFAPFSHLRGFPSILEFRFVWPWCCENSGRKLSFTAAKYSRSWFSIKAHLPKTNRIQLITTARSVNTASPIGKRGFSISSIHIQR